MTLKAAAPVTQALSIDDLVDMAVPALPRGRRRSTLPPSFVREMTREDVATVATGAPPQQPLLQRIRTTHHMAARLLAEGRQLVEVSAITGYTPGRLQQLRNDPAFCELLEHYKVQHDGRYANFHERLAGLGMSFVEELQQRLEEQPEAFSNDEVMRAIEKLLDRGGYGPKSTREVNVNARSFALSVIEMVKSEGKSAGRVLEVSDLLEGPAA